MIVLSSNNDSTFKQRRKYLQDTKMIAINLWDMSHILELV